MGIRNNNGHIQIRLEYRGNRYSLSHLGSYDDPVALQRAHELETQIKRNLKAGLGSYICGCWKS